MSEVVHAARRGMYRRALHFVRSRPWLSTCTVVFVAAAVVLAAAGTPPASALLLGFDLGAVIYLVALSRLFRAATGARVAQQARLQDSGRRTTLAVAVSVSLIVLVALATELHAARHGGAIPVVVAAASVVLSWLFMNTSFALHYAHAYYGDDGRLRGGLQFPGDDQPDYWDFVYYSFVIGMCFQTSDVSIAGRHMRRLTLLHGVVAFFFNVFILAISVSVVSGIVG